MLINTIQEINLCIIEQRVSFEVSYKILVSLTDLQTFLFSKNRPLIIKMISTCITKHPKIHGLREIVVLFIRVNDHFRTYPPTQAGLISQDFHICRPPNHYGSQGQATLRSIVLSAVKHHRTRFVSAYKSDSESSHG